MRNTTVKVIIPTYNAGEPFGEVISMLLQQEGFTSKDILVIDSSSQDGTAELVQTAGIECRSIPQAEFGHGKTRKWAAELAGDVDIVVFMTQDALPHDTHTIANLVSYFAQDSELAAVYGRQLPYAHTDIFGRHARLFNYPAVSSIKSLADRDKYGIKTAFFSDTFGAYRQEILQRLGSFPDVAFSEDACMAAKMLIAGYKVGYCAEAMVYHSHTFTVLEEYRRYQQIGRFYQQEHWLLDTFGKAEGEGLRFVQDQVKYLLKEGKWYLLPELVVRNGMKYLGYTTGGADVH